MANLPQFTLTELLEAGVHFGHRTHRWNPQLAPYIFGTRNGIHIIDLQQTVPMLYRAMGLLKTTVAGGGRVLFVGTKRQAQQPIAETAERCGMYFVNHRWLGGMLTNWKTIGASIKRLKKLEEEFAQSAEAEAKITELEAAATEENPADLSQVKDPQAHFNKKERLMRRREMDKLNLVLGGIKNMGGLPDVIVVLDVKKDNIAIQEAGCLGIPVIGVVDTNTSDKGVGFVVPGNDDSARAINLYCRLFSDSILAGIEEQATSSAHRSEGQAVRTTGSKREAKVRLSAKAQEAANAPDEKNDSDVKTATKADTKAIKVKAVKKVSAKETEPKAEKIAAKEVKKPTAKKAALKAEKPVAKATKKPATKAPVKKAAEPAAKAS